MVQVSTDNLGFWVLGVREQEVERPLGAAGSQLPTEASFFPSSTQQRLNTSTHIHSPPAPPPYFPFNK